jgi:putative nucleotidyltransferase with HDIG domain
VQIIAGTILFFLEAPRIEGNLELLLLLIALNIAAELMPIGIYGDSYVSVGFVLTTAMIILFGAPGVVIVAPIEAVAGRIGRRHLDYKALTNGMRFIIVYWLAAKAFELVAGYRPTDITLDVAFGVALSTVICLGLLVALIAAKVTIETGRDPRPIVEQHVWLVPQYAVMAMLGLILAAAYNTLGMLGVLAFITPAIAMRLTMKLYVDKTADNVSKLTQQNEALRVANVEITRMSSELQDSYDATLEALVNALDARDQETKGHSIRVSHYMMDIARELGVNPDSQTWLDMQRGSLLHDVGKIGVSDNILLKPGQLTPEEWESMRKHPEIGYNMLRQVKFLQGAAEIILAHHERWDGAGYPFELHEDEIPLGARIFSVVDTFDSMTSDRSYRKAKSTLEAMDEILRHSGSQFDPLVVEAFLDIYQTWEKEREELHMLTAAKRVA